MEACGPQRFLDFLALSEAAVVTAEGVLAEETVVDVGVLETVV